MLRGVFTKLEFPLACIPTRDSTVNMLFLIVWEAVHNVSLKYYLLLLMEQLLTKIFCIHATTPNEVVLKTPNLYGIDNFYVPHLLKTV